MTAVNAAAPLRSAPPPRQPADAPQTSPTMQAASPSTVQASPLSTPHPASFAGSSAPRLKASDKSAPRARLACQRCRRSKIKCGDDSGRETKPCPQCVKAGVPCTWPGNDSNSPAEKRQYDSAGHDTPSGDRHTEPRRRKKVPPSVTSKQLLLTEDDIYDPLLYSEKVWEELYDIFKLHYATELPFLHGATFLARLKQTDIARLKQTDIQALPEPFAPLVLAFLALTVPFHDDLLRQLHCQDPRDVSRRYADAADFRIYNRVLNSPRLLDTPTIEVAQALLMLGLRAHGDELGSQTFHRINDAASCMQYLGCDREVGLEDKRHPILPKSRPTNAKESHSSGPVDEDEVKRRVFWSCYILDIYASLGDYKTRRIDLAKTCVQLPCSDEQFDCGFKTKTRMLGETDEQFHQRKDRYLERSEATDVRWEDEDAQEALVWFIKALEIFGDVMSYVCTVTRLNDTSPVPYVEDSNPSVKLNFKKLDKRLDKLVSKLPAPLKWAPSRHLLDAKILRRTSTPYVLLHVVLCECRIVLHREYLPFITHRTARPRGPVTPTSWFQSPTIWRGKEMTLKQRFHEDPEADIFWKESASCVFRATRDCLDLLLACNRQNVLPETPLVSLTTYTVGFTVMWCAFYPNMDQDGYVCKGQDRADELVVKNFEQVYELLSHLQKRITMARGQCRKLHKFFKLIDEISGYYPDVVDSPGSADSSSTEFVDEQNLDLYRKEIHRALTQFGEPDEHPVDSPLSLRTPDVRELLAQFERMNIDRATDYNSPSAIKSEDGMSTEASTETGSAPPRCSTGSSFTAVNAESYQTPTPKQDLASRPQSHYQPPSTPTYQQPISYHPTVAMGTDSRQYPIGNYPMISEERATEGILHDQPAYLHSNPRTNSAYQRVDPRVATAAFNSLLGNQGYNFTMIGAQDVWDFQHPPEPTLYMHNEYYPNNQGS